MSKLTREQELELLSWVESFEISRPSRRLSRDFSDAGRHKHRLWMWFDKQKPFIVPLAEILKSIFPKWVDLHNYQACNSVHLKEDNWATLSRKVLRKLDVVLDSERIQNLSQADSDAINDVLYEVMKKSQAYLETKASKGNTSQNSNSTGDIMTISVEQQNGDKVQKQMILYSMYQELEQMVSEKNQVILIMSQKNEHLENMMKLKEQQIHDLVQQVERLKKSPRDWLSLD